MRRLSRLGAAALAMALSLTMVAPISANAQVIYNRDGATGFATYTNEDTKETFTETDDLTFAGGMSEAMASEQKVYYISTNDYADIELSTTPEVAKLTGFKSSKKALKIRVERLHEVTKGTGGSYSDYAYRKTENGVTKYYYRDIDAAGLEKLGVNSGSYRIRVYAKKAGKYTIKYNAVNADGVSVASKKITVIAKEDARAIKSITYGGKNIFEDTNGDGRFDYTKYYSVSKRDTYTTKKKGKLVVTANKDFKITKIEIGTPVQVTKNLTTTDPTGTETYSYDAIDLNGNGRTNDVVNGIEESHVHMTWKTVKNKKTIKLSKVEDNESDNYNKSWKSGQTEVESEHGNFAPTTIRVHYYDKKNKITSYQDATINLRVRK